MTMLTTSMTSNRLPELAAAQEQVAWIDPASYAAMLACKDGCLRYLTRSPREGDIALYATPPDAAASIAEMEAERDRLLSMAHRLALDLECLLLSTDNPAATKWWDESNATLQAWRKIKNDGLLAEIAKEATK